MINLITLLLTGGSWFILGLFYGIGYCPLTEWHFQILEQLGHNDLPYSYIEYLIERITPFNLTSLQVDTTTTAVFIAAFGLSVVLNVRDRKISRDEQGNEKTQDGSGEG